MNSREAFLTARYLADLLQKKKKEKTLISSQPYRILARLNLLRIREIPLHPDLIHNLHNHHTLLPPHRLAFQLPVSQRPGASIRFPEHSVAWNRLVVFFDVPIIIIITGNETPVRGSERRPVDLELAFSALDADGGSSDAFAVRVGRDAQVGQSDAHGGFGVVRGAGECEEDGGGFVDAGLVVMDHLGGDGWGFALLRWENVVKGLEDPG